MQIRPPKRVSRTYTQQLCGVPAAVFPLLCPVREADWIDGWDPRLVLSESGVAEADCVFITEAEPQDAVWYITRHEPATGLVEMIKIVPELTACRLNIQVRAAPGGSEADVSYTHTSLGPQGDSFVESFTEDYYELFMQDWEARVNHYLTTGELLGEDEEADEAKED
jgi:hypothetical protein